MTIAEIYYADDDLDDLEIFEEAVKQLTSEENLQINLHTYMDGERLLQSVRSHRNPGMLVFLDINMPEKNGYDILREIRADKHVCTLPVIMFSTSSNAQTIKTCYDYGASLYTTKPGNFNELKKVIRQIMQIDWKTFRHENYDLFSALRRA